MNVNAFVNVNVNMYVNMYFFYYSVCRQMQHYLWKNQVTSRLRSKQRELLFLLLFVEILVHSPPSFFFYLSSWSFVFLFVFVFVFVRTMMMIPRSRVVGIAIFVSSLRCNSSYHLLSQNRNDALSFIRYCSIE